MYVPHNDRLTHFAPPFILCHLIVFYESFFTTSSIFFGGQDINEIKKENEYDLMVLTSRDPFELLSNEGNQPFFFA